MLTNFIRAKMTTHGLLVALGVVGFAVHRFLSDPHAEAWLQGHWFVKNIFETIGATLVAYGIYRSPTSPSA